MQGLDSDYRLQEQLQKLALGELDEEETYSVIEHHKLSLIKEQIEFNNKLMRVLRNKDVLDVKMLVTSLIIEEGLPKPGTRFFSSGNRWSVWILGLIISTGLLIGGSQLPYFQKWSHYKEYRLAQKYLSPLENVVFTGSNGVSNQDLNTGMDAYNRQEYSTAILHLGRYFAASKDPNAGLYLAVSCLLKNNNRQATAVFDNIVGKLETPALQWGQWYQSLAHLKEGNTEAASEILHSLKDDPMLGESASKLLIELIKN